MIATDEWLSKSGEVLIGIPESERASSVVNMNFDNALPCDRALGVLWNVNDDRICFKVKLEGLTYLPYLA